MRRNASKSGKRIKEDTSENVKKISGDRINNVAKIRRDEGPEHRCAGSLVQIVSHLRGR